VIDRAEILRFGDEFGLEPRIVEKDYVLGWVLAGIYRDPNLAATWVFKGGTCIKKCFFETYRFSEDLDFTVTDAAQLDAAFLETRFLELGIGFMKRRVLNCLPTSDGLKYMTTGEAEDAARDGLAIAGR